MDLICWPFWMLSDNTLFHVIHSFLSYLLSKLSDFFYVLRNKPPLKLTTESFLIWCWTSIKKINCMSITQNLLNADLWIFFLIFIIFLLLNSNQNIWIIIFIDNLLFLAFDEKLLFIDSYLVVPQKYFKIFINNFKLKNTFSN